MSELASRVLSGSGIVLEMYVFVCILMEGFRQPSHSMALSVSTSSTSSSSSSSSPPSWVRDRERLYEQASQEAMLTLLNAGVSDLAISRLIAQYLGAIYCMSTFLSLASAPPSLTML